RSVFLCRNGNDLGESFLALRPGPVRPVSTPGRYRPGDSQGIGGGGVGRRSGLCGPQRPQLGRPPGLGRPATAFPDSLAQAAAHTFILSVPGLDALGPGTAKAKKSRKDKRSVEGILADSRAVRLVGECG